MYDRSYVSFCILIFIIASLFFSQGIIFAATTTEVLNITAVVPSPGGGGGGGTPPITPTEVNFLGKAYPNSTVTLLKDAQFLDSTTASTDSDFEIVIIGITGGTYLFSFYSEDVYGIRSNLVTLSVEVTEGAVTTVSGIFLPPTIETDKSAVKQGDELIIFGQTIGNGEVVIEISSGTTSSSTIMTTNSNVDGLYEYHFDTSPLSYGDYTVKSKAAVGTVESSYGKIMAFAVGNANVFKEEQEPTFLIGDLNDDGKVDIVDFSIAAFWYKNSPLSEEFAAIEAERLNNDGKVDLVDFSIMAYYWTG